MSLCISIKIMYKEYYYDFEKLTYRLTLTNVSLKSSQSSKKFILKVEKNIQMNSQKVKAIMNWQVFKSVKSVQSFINFANFYQKFIKNFFNLIMSMMTLIQKNTLFK